MLGFEGYIRVCRAGRQQVDEDESRRKSLEFQDTPQPCVLAACAPAHEQL